MIQIFRFQLLVINWNFQLKITILCCVENRVIKFFLNICHIMDQFEKHFMFKLQFRFLWSSFSWQTMLAFILLWKTFSNNLSSEHMSHIFLMIWQNLEDPDSEVLMHPPYRSNFAPSKNLKVVVGSIWFSGFQLFPKDVIWNGISQRKFKDFTLKNVIDQNGNWYGS